MISKSDVHQGCLELVKQKITVAEKLIDSAKKASQGDTKSSAGDKYETGRAMAQQEIEKAYQQLEQASLLYKSLQQINPDKVCTSGEFGSLIETDQGLFYISVGLGMIIVQAQNVFAISMNAPICKVLLGVAERDSFDFNGRKYQVLSVA